MVLAAARDCGALLTVEEHQVNGGLGSADRGGLRV
jgi:transketolase C-terminal domain/subunit